nr:MAG TPA: hypothetical protein [Caudoviricetes sp.]
MKKIEIELTPQSITSAIKQLRKLDDEWNRKTDELIRRLAAIGATKASLGFSRAVYTGDNDVSVSVEQIDNGYSILASGEAVLFIEFGSGVTYGYGHPEPKQYGPGTYPGEGHWNDPKGWYLPKGKGGVHTYGNPPSATMYRTGKELRQGILRIAKEVFNGS